MKLKKEDLIESWKKRKTSKVRDTLASVMISGGLLNAAGIPMHTVPSTVYNYWQRTLAPTKKQQIYSLSKKYENQATTRDEQGRKVLDIGLIPDKKDRLRFERLVSK